MKATGLGGVGNMKFTGIVRRVDDLGRLVIPMELRRTLAIEVKDPIEVFVDGEQIVLRKYMAGCVFCDGMVGLQEYLGKLVCAACRDEMKARIKQGT